MKRIAALVLIVGLSATVGCGKSKPEPVATESGTRAPKGGPKRAAINSDAPNARVVMSPLPRPNGQ